jgi:hypothetical protein
LSKEKRLGWRMFPALDQTFHSWRQGGRQLEDIGLASIPWYCIEHQCVSKGILTSLHFTSPSRSHDVELGYLRGGAAASIID